MTAARVAEALERTVSVPHEEADRRLRTLPGIGVWTSAEARAERGDPDAVSFGDYHVAKDIGWALARRPFDDVELEAFLEPWRGHRGRVQAAGRARRPAPPRRGPGCRRAATSRRASPGAAAPVSGQGAIGSEQRTQRSEHELRELAVQVPGLPLAAREAQGCWTRRPKISSSAFASASSMTSTLIS